MMVGVAQNMKAEMGSIDPWGTLEAGPIGINLSWGFLDKGGLSV